MKLSVKLPLLIILSATIVAAAVGILQFLTVQASIINRENEANINSVNGYASSVGFYLNQARDIMAITASEVEAPWLRTISTPGYSEEELHQSVHNTATSILENSKTFEYIMFLDTDGTVRVMGPHELRQSLSRNNLGYTAWYKKLMSTGQAVTSDLHISPATQRPTVVVATPLHGPEGQIIGIVAGGLNLEQLSQIGMTGLQSGQPLRYGLITDSRGLIIAHQANPNYVLEQTDFRSVPPIRAALSGQQGTMRFISPIDGIDKLAAYMPLPGTGWAAEYWVPAQVAFEPLNRLLVYLIGLALLMVILMGLGSLLITRQVTGPLRHLSTAIEKIGGGDLSQRIQVRGKDEISQLGGEFNRMAESLQAATLERDRAEAEKLRAEGVAAAARVARDMIENMSDPVILASPDGRIEAINRATTDLWGYGEEIIGTLPTILVVEREANVVFGVIKDAMEKGFAKNVQHTALTKDGREVPILLSVVMLKDRDENPVNIVSIIRDISEIKRAADNLKESEERFRIASASASDTIWEWDIPSGRLDWYGKIDEILGYQPGEFPRTIEAWEKAIHTDDIGHVNAKLEQHLKEATPYADEYRIQRKDGTYCYWVDHGTALRNDAGEPVKMIGACSDISERKKAEKWLAEKTEQLERSNAELQSFAYVASHDLQEPLRTISSYMQLLEKRYKPKLDKDAQEFIDFAVTGANRLQNMIGGLLEYSRVETRGDPFEMVSCEWVLDHVVGDLKKAIDESKANITHDPLPEIFADQMQLTRLFQNLVANSIRYHGSGPPRIHVSAATRDGDYVFAVKDNGIGIDPEYKEQIFVIFQRLQGREVPGIGLGLAVAKKIVERHGGRIWLESEPGKGATFYFTIPIKGGNKQ